MEKKLYIAPLTETVDAEMDQALMIGSGTLAPSEEITDPSDIGSRQSDDDDLWED